LIGGDDNPGEETGAPLHVALDVHRTHPGPDARAGLDDRAAAISQAAGHRAPDFHAGDPAGADDRAGLEAVAAAHVAPDRHRAQATVAAVVGGPRFGGRRGGRSFVRRAAAQDLAASIAPAADQRAAHGDHADPGVAANNA